MNRYRVNQHLIVLNFSRIIYYCKSVAESTLDVKYVNAVKPTTQQVCVFKSNRMFGTKHLKTNRLQKTIEYKTNEQSTKDSY